MFGASDIMITIAVIVFVIGSVIFGLMIAPSIAARIASARGLDYKKWFFYCIVFNVFALVWLCTSSKFEQTAEKRALVMLIVAYIGIFAGAYLIDKYTAY